MHAEVLERAEKPAFERLPQPQLGGDPAVEPLQDALAVGAFGRGGEARAAPSASEVLEQPPVGRRRGVVELVDDDDVEGVGRQIGPDRRCASDWTEANTCRHSSGRWPST